MRTARLEAVLIGNAAAAIQGAPVTTVDVDFLFRKTAPNLAKLRLMATRMQGTILRPYYPVSDLYRLVRDLDGLQVDYMATIHGVRKFEGVRDRATSIEIEGVPFLIASLVDIIRSKRAAGRPQDLAVLPILERKPLKRKRGRKAKLDALARESERNVEELIRRWQALPPERRTQFLRKRVGIGRTAL